MASTPIAEKGAAEYGAPGAKVYTDYRELLANPDVEVVHVLTPNVSHSEITIAAFEAAVSGKWAGGSIAIRRKKGRKYAVTFDVVPLASVAKETKSMPDAFIAENGHDVTDAFLAYARPLVGELPVKAMLKGME